MIAHIVLFSPKKSLGSDERRSFAKSVVTAGLSMPQIKSVRVGRQIDVDPGYARSMGDKTYEFAAVMEFDNRQALVSYLAAPQHAELGRLFWESCESTVVTEVEYVDLSAADAVDVLVR